MAIELPEDIAAEEVDFEFTTTESFPKIRRPVIDEKSLLLLKTELEKAHTPMLLI